METTNVILIVIAILSVMYVNFIPTLVAGNRSHSEVCGIFVLNFFLVLLPIIAFFIELNTSIPNYNIVSLAIGVSFSIWVIALIWAISSKK